MAQQKCVSCHGELSPLDQGPECTACRRLSAQRKASANGSTNVAEQPTLELSSSGGKSAPGPVATEFQAGDRVTYFGDYELLGEIARGGMGVVYRARQVSLNRIVALKMILTGTLANQADVERFRHEAEAAANLDHPGIVPVYEVGEHQGRHYFSMALVEGPSLAQRLREGPLAPRAAAELVRRSAEAIQYAHSRGIIHRDLKPANILLAAGEEPKITDFGLAKRLSVDSHLTITGQILGTPSYMAPEQASGTSAEVTIQTDVYALGAILYACLIGHPPFQADNVLDTLKAVLEQDPVPLRQANAAVPRDLEVICLKCLEKRPARRYATAGELRDELSRFLDGEPILARQAGSFERGWRWARRHQALVGVSAAVIASLVALVAVGVTVVIGGLYTQAQQARLAAEQSQVIAEEQRQFAVAAETKAQREKLVAQRAEVAATQNKERVRQVLYAADIQVARNHWQANRPVQMRELLEQHVPAKGAFDLRGFEWHYLWRLANSPQRTLRGHAQPIDTLAFAGSTGDLLSGDVEYQYRTPGTLRKWPGGRADEALTLFTQPVSPDRAGYYPGIRALAVSPDGSHCALVDSGVVRVLKVETGEPTRVLDAWNGSAQAVAFAPDGRHLAVGDRGGEITIWDVETGDKSATIGKQTLSIQRLEFSPDGTRLAAASGDGSAPTWSQLLNGELWLWDVKTEKQVAQCRGVRSFVHDLSVNAQGTTVAAATMEGTIVLWDLKRTEGARILRGHTGPVNAVRWLPNGRYLASGGDDGTVQVWDIGREEAKQVYKGHNGPVTALAVSADGNSLASGGRDTLIQLWDPRVDPERTIVRDLPYAIGTVAYSGDGQWLAIGTYTQVSVRDTRRFEKRHVLPIDHWVFGTAISHDGRLVATAGNQGSSGEEPGVVKVWDVTTGAARHTFDPQVLSAQRVAFSADGRLLACSGRAGRGGEFAVTVWDVEQGQRLGSRLDTASFAFLPNTSSLALAGRGGAWLWHWDGESMNELSLVPRACREIRFAPDGQRLAVIDAEGQLSLWFVADSREQPLGPVLGSVEFSPDGRRVAAFGKSSTTIWDAEDGRIVTTIPFTTDHLRFTPDGRTLVTAGREVHLWQVETGRELLNLGAYATGGVKTVAVSPDGTQLAVGGGYRDEHEGVWIWHAPLTQANTQVAPPP